MEDRTLRPHSQPASVPLAFRRPAQRDRTRGRVGQRSVQPRPSAGRRPGPACALDGEASMQGAGGPAVPTVPELHSRSGSQMVQGRANSGLRGKLSGAIAYHPWRWNLQLRGTRLLKKTQHPPSEACALPQRERMCDWLSLSSPTQTTSFEQSRMLHTCVGLSSRIY